MYTADIKVGGRYEINLPTALNLRKTEICSCFTGLTRQGFMS